MISGDTRWYRIILVFLLWLTKMRQVFLKQYHRKLAGLLPKDSSSHKFKCETAMAPWGNFDHHSCVLIWIPLPLSLFTRWVWWPHTLKPFPQPRPCQIWLTFTILSQPPLINVAFTWKGFNKAGSSSFYIGTSPAFEMALYTACFMESLVTARVT